MLKKLLLLFSLSLFSLANENPIVLINDIRANSGLNTLIENPILNTSSINHGNYINFNRVVGHNERSNRPYFTGEKPVDRAAYAGYQTLNVLENISSGQKTFSRSIDSLMSAIYHRFGFLDFNINEIGYGVSKTSYVYNMGNSYLNELCNGNSFEGEGKYIYNVCHNKNFKIEAKTYYQGKNTLIDENPEYVIHPYNNQTQVPPVFYQESPDPLPRHKVSGYPLSIQFNENSFDISKFKLIGFQLLDKTLLPVDLISHKGDTTMTYKNDPNKKFKKHQFAIFPEKRLNYNTTYHGRFSYIYEGVSQSIEWSFETKKIEDLIIYEDEPLEIELDKSYHIYIPPSTSWDVISKVSSNCSYLNTGSVDIISDLYDNNTLKVRISGKKVKGCEVKLNNKKKLNLTIKQQN